MSSAAAPRLDLDGKRHGSFTTMKLEVQIGGRVRNVEIEPENRKLICRLDGQPIEADAVEISPGLYSIVLDGQVFEVRVESRAERLSIAVAGKEFAARIVDRRRWRRREGALELQGRQQITAPMPGKIVRVLVQAGQLVEAGQGLLVVEAMKMQNEIRAPKAGKLERLRVTEGQAVNAGDVLAIVG